MAERLLIEARNITVAVEDGRTAAPHGRYETVLRFPDAELWPGLINAHDHLHRNHYGRLSDPPYADAYGWVADVRTRYAAQVAAGKAMPRRQALLRGAWKNLFAGVTTVVHHDRWEPDFEDHFPIRVAHISWANSFGVPPGPEALDTEQPYAMHLAEGCNARAADEVRQLDELGLLGPRLLAVHGVGMDADGIARFRSSGAALVWCPSSNLFLLGRTVTRELLEGVDVLLGSDSLLTGGGDLLAELRTARATGLLEEARLEAAVGPVAAARLGLEPPSLDPGARADLAVFSRPLLEASAADVQLVLVGGRVTIAAPHLAASLGEGRTMNVGGVTRWVASPHQPMNRTQPLANQQDACRGI